MKTIIRLCLLIVLANLLDGCALTDYLCNDLHWNPTGYGDATFWFC